MRIVQVNPVSSVSEHIEKVINLRGQVIPVLNLNRRLDLPEKEKDGETRIIVVERGGSKIGLIVDRVLEVGRYNDANVVAPDVIGQTVEYISGFIRKDEHIWLLLNTEAVCERWNYPRS